MVLFIVSFTQKLFNQALMPLFHQQISVPFDYPVWCGHDLFGTENTVLEETFRNRPIRRLQIVCETAILKRNPALESAIRAKVDALKTAGLCDPVEPLLLSFGGGEHVKNIDSALELCRCFEQSALCRHSAVMAIGGGAFLDVVGFATALNHRGLRLIRVPTTTLSQCDSGVGVKNGIDAFGKKNFLGVFQPPYAVFNDYDLLHTLPDAEWLAGVPEAVKVSMIKDRDFFEWLMDNATAFKARDIDTMAQLIERSAKCHLDHIAQNGDPFEMGSARPLDFGHWAGHKLEAMSSYRIGHGGGVAIGLLLDSHIAMSRGLLALSELERLHGFFAALGLPCTAPELERRSTDGTLEILGGIEEFREHLGGTLQITLPDGIGQLIQTDRITADEVETAIAWLNKKAN